AAARVVDGAARRLEVEHALVLRRRLGGEVLVTHDLQPVEPAAERGQPQRGGDGDDRPARAHRGSGSGSGADPAAFSGTADTMAPSLRTNSTCSSSGAGIPSSLLARASTRCGLDR